MAGIGSQPLPDGEYGPQVTFRKGDSESAQYVAAHPLGRRSIIENRRALPGSFIGRLFHSE